MCDQHHEQMLMLTCMHDPCINCAAVHYCSTQPSSSQVYICAKCGEYTELDSSSVAELQRVYQLLKVPPTPTLGQEEIRLPAQHSPQQHQLLTRAAAQQQILPPAEVVPPLPHFPQ